MDLRAKRITNGLNLSGVGIEYGPLHRTIVPKDTFPDVRYVDYASREFLLKKFGDDPSVNQVEIPEIDIVTEGKPIGEFVSENSLNYVIASHVIEHVPDLIGWLEANLAILKPGGRIAAAFPDRRFCFDLARSKTMFSDLVAAYLEKRTKPTFHQISDHFMNTVRSNPTNAWNKVITPENARPVRTPQSAIGILRELQKQTNYVDCHCWKFSYSECNEMLEEIKKYFPIKFEIVSFFPTQRYTQEFYFMIEKPANTNVGA